MYAHTCAQACVRTYVHVREHVQNVCTNELAGCARGSSQGCADGSYLRCCCEHCFPALGVHGSVLGQAGAVAGIPARCLISVESVPISSLPARASLPSCVLIGVSLG